MDRRVMEVNQCRLCCRYHPLRFCHAFRAMTPDERYESARIHKYCINCLATSHTTGACSSADSCHRCGMAHHTMLHRPTASPPERQRHAKSRTQVPRGLPTLASRVVKTPASRAPGGRNKVQRRIRDLLDRARVTLEKLQELLHVAPVQVGRHVEDMSANLIEFD
ncbi:uncharacterized protein LOC118749688 [Rhagoletis pomonella]|uniref:uncharacterized protein LOC118749688 n=1 Tax=Rhagoletis pomonella TaxID=28610 RepID=UPI001783E669|nr:uncharacterized protein LOC118749688 [Rhagoletis pomonella]